MTCSFTLVLFDNYLPQDAHEFLNYLLNQIADILQTEQSHEEASKKHPSGDIPLSPAINKRTWIHEIFQGTLTNETRCLNCETVRTKDEDFLDLSVDIKPYTSITNCLQCFSNTETIQSENKYYCEVCRCKQEAQKRFATLEYHFFFPNQ